MKGDRSGTTCSTGSDALPAILQSLLLGDAAAVRCVFGVDRCQNGEQMKEGGQKASQQDSKGRPLPNTLLLHTYGTLFLTHQETRP